MVNSGDSKYARLNAPRRVLVVLEHIHSLPSTDSTNIPAGEEEGERKKMSLVAELI